MVKKFDMKNFLKKFRTMLSVDLRRMLLSPFARIMVGVSFLMPILILVMTTMMDGTVSVDHQTGKETVIEGFDNVWQIIGTTTAAAGSLNMDLTGMCNINMLYFLISALVCVFIGEDFRCGYAKNIFTVRADKTDYVASKTVVCTLGGAVMVLAFFLGSMLGGAVSGVPFDMVGFSVPELIMCLISKLAIVAVFVPIYIVASVFARDKVWLSIIASMCVGMLFFMMIPMLTPLDSTPINALATILGGVLFSVGMGAVSRVILNKSDLI